MRVYQFRHIRAERQCSGEGASFRPSAGLLGEMPERDQPRLRLSSDTRRWLREEISRRRREQAVATGRLSDGRAGSRRSPRR